MPINVLSEFNCSSPKLPRSRRVLFRRSINLCGRKQYKRAAQLIAGDKKMSQEKSIWPLYGRLPADLVQMYAEFTRDGHYDLSQSEKTWQEIGTYLKERGYSLRMRYDDDWKPSWIGTNLDPAFCEDSIRPLVHNVMDARREDGCIVALKRVKNTTQEIAISQYLSSPDVRSNPTNHSVPIFDLIPDPKQSDTSYLVMPLLRPFDHPDFCFVEEVIEFVRQTLQGLCFMHDLRVAHRDCAGLNIMMDGGPLYPRGFHPMRQNYSSDGKYPITSLNRIDHPVRYYFIDYGLSSRFPPGAASYVVGGKGRDKTVPELSLDIPYDAFKVDIYSLGNTYHQAFYKKFQGLDFLLPLIEAMTEEIPAHRPTATDALLIFSKIHSDLIPMLGRTRLRSRDEIFPESIVRDAYETAKWGVTNLRRLVGQ